MYVPPRLFSSLTGMLGRPAEGVGAEVGPGMTCTRLAFHLNGMLGLNVASTNTRSPTLGACPLTQLVNMKKVVKSDSRICKYETEGSSIQHLYQVQCLS